METYLQINEVYLPAKGDLLLNEWTREKDVLLSLMVSDLRESAIPRMSTIRICKSR